MGDDSAHDPTMGPTDLPGPDVGVSITFDSAGHPLKLGIDVPGTAQGSDQAEIDLSGRHDPARQDPGWMPNFNQDPPLSIMDMPPPPGHHWDPITHIAIPDAAPDVPASGDSSWGDTSGYGDYPEPSGDEANV